MCRWRGAGSSVAWVFVRRVVACRVVERRSVAERRRTVVSAQGVRYIYLISWSIGVRYVYIISVFYNTVDMIYAYNSLTACLLYSIPYIHKS